MKKIIIMFLFVFMLLSLVSAEDGISMQIQNNTISIGVYTVSLGGRLDTGDLLINRFTAPIVCDLKNITEINSTTNISSAITYNCSYILVDIPFKTNLTNQTCSNQSDLLCISQNTYETCLNEKAQFNAGLNSCTEVKNKNEGIANNYTTCSSSLAVCQSERSTATGQVTTLTTEGERTKNQKYIWGIIGAVLSTLIILYLKGDLGKPKARNPEGDYNKGQSA